MSSKNKNGFRTLLAILLTLATVMFGYIAMTVPLIAMTGPAILTVACGVAAFFAWRGWGGSREPEAEKTIRLTGRPTWWH